MTRAKALIVTPDNYLFKYPTFDPGLKTHVDLRTLETTKIFLAYGEV